MRWLVIAVALAAGAALFGAFRQEALADRVEGLAAEIRALRAASERRTESAGIAPALLDPAERDLLAQLIAAKLAAAPAAARPPAAPQAVQPEKPAPHEPTPAQRAAAEQATKVFDAALSKGSLRREDALELRRLLRQADPAASDELRRQIVVAINRDQLELTDPAVELP